jgi:hypothetical protein
MYIYVGIHYFIGCTGKSLSTQSKLHKTLHYLHNYLGYVGCRPKGIKLVAMDCQCEKSYLEKNAKRALINGT